MLGENNYFFGKTHTQKSKEKISKTLKEKPKKIYFIYMTRQRKHRSL